MNLRRSDFASYKDLRKEEIKPFHPIRPREAIIRTDLEQRKKMESHFKAKIKGIQKTASMTGVVINPENERVLRKNKEEWMLVLQEIYDKIHDELSKLIKSQQQPGARLNGEQATRFKEILDKQMADTENMMASLLVPEKKSVQSSREGVLIAKQFRASLKQLYLLMESVGVTQIQKEFASNFEFVKRLRQLRSKDLNREISNSTQRLEKVRLGNTLGKVLGVQKAEYESLQQAERTRRLAEFTKLRKKYPYDTDIRFDEPTYFKDKQQKQEEIKEILSRFNKMGIEEDDNGARIEDEESDSTKKYKNSFKNRLKKVEELVDKMVNIEGPNVDFHQKYQNINLYFSERKSLNNLYMGENRLSDFLQGFQKKCSEIDEIRKRKQSQDDRNNQSFDSLIIDFDSKEETITGEQQNVKDDRAFREPEEIKEWTTQNKVTAINMEIQKKLALDEHQEKMQQIKRLGVEQNQNFWDQLLAKSNGKVQRKTLTKASTSHGSRPVLQNKQREIKIAPQSIHEDDLATTPLYLTEISPTSQSNTRFGFEPQKSASTTKLPATAAAQREREKQKWLESQQRLILNAHPNNPILKIAFSENKKLSYQNLKTPFTTEPVTNDNNFLVRRRAEYAKTAQPGKRNRQHATSEATLNLNQVADGNNFRDTFYSNYYLFTGTNIDTNRGNTVHSSGTEATDLKSMFSSTGYTIRYPTANSKERPFKFFGITPSQHKN